MQHKQFKIKYPSIPVSGARDEILAALVENQVVVVVGDTGSGKTTQLPKMALEYARSIGSEGLIGCTQPRRLAAVSVAKRVSEELQVELGNEVGYQVRFQDKTSRSTLVKFMTDGILLAESQGDVRLEKYAILIIDEAHERSLNIDFLLGYLKQLLVRRPELRVVISSATLDAGGFSAFFGGAPVIQVEGRTFPVETHYLPKQEDEYLGQHVARAVEWIMQEDQSGDVLVFLPGEREIRECVDVLVGRNWRGMEILPLYARMSIQDQQQVFSPSGKARRVVLATNVAETSLTIPGIVYVIDTGIARVSRWSPGRQVQRLQIEKISQASANQRKGRCGRVREGVCVRLYEEDDYEARSEFTDPEIRRSSLAGVILRMKSLGLAAVEEFPFLDPPSPKNINEGYRTLREIGALNEVHELTAVGRQLARVPVEPRLARMLLEAERRGCLSEVLVVVSGLSIMDPRERPNDKAKQADEAHKRWDDENSDFLSLLNLWVDLQQFKDGRKWRQNALRKFCQQRFLNFRRVLEWNNLMHELAVICREAFHWKTHPMQSGMGEWAQSEAIHKSLLSGIPRQIGRYDKEKRHYQGASASEFAIFPGSGLFGKNKLEWVIAYEMVDTTRLWARRVAKLDPTWVEEVAPNLCRSRYHSPVWDRKQGAVYAKEDVLCGGLPVVLGRRLHLGKVDLKTARHIFIRDGLLGGGLKKRPNVLKRIDALRDEVRELEQKLRRIDGIWHEEAVVEYFEERLPSTLCTARDFWRWMDKYGGELQPVLGDFLYEELPDADDYPDTIVWGDESYSVYYRVAPNEADDGVTLGVHIDQLVQLPTWLPQWGVPGTLAERVLLLIKSLPKSQRIACNPAGVTAEEFSEIWRHQEKSRGLYEELAEYLSKRSRVKIEPGMFDPAKLPDELVTKIWVCDDDGNEVALGRDVAKLQRQLESVMTARFEEESGAEFDFSAMKCWECGELPAQVENSRGVGYPALVDDGAAVSVRVFTDALEAESSHLAGCVRLFLIKHEDQAKYVSKHIPLRMETKMYLPMLGEKGVNHGELLRVAAEGVFRNGLPRDEAAFRTAAAEGRGTLYERAQEACGWFDVFVSDQREVENFLEIARGDKNLEEIGVDLQEEMSWLLRMGFTRTAGWQWLQHYPLIFKAMKERISRLKANPVMRDLEKMDRVLDYWLPWHAKWKSDRENLALIECGMQLELLRVSLFAPNLRLPVSVSEKKLRSELEAHGIHKEIR